MTDSQSGQRHPRSAGGVQAVAAFRARRLAERAALRQRLARGARADRQPAAAAPAEAPPAEDLLAAALPSGPEQPLTERKAEDAPPASAAPCPAAAAELEPPPSVFSALLGGMEAGLLPGGPPRAAPDLPAPAPAEFQADAPETDEPQADKPQADEPPEDEDRTDGAATDEAGTGGPPSPISPEPEPEPPAPAARAEGLSRPVLGLGPGMRMRLQQLGYSTIDDLAHADPAHLREALGEISQLIDIDAWIASARRMRG